jgi:hypothetical protein
MTSLPKAHAEGDTARDTLLTGNDESWRNGQNFKSEEEGAAFWLLQPRSIAEEEADTAAFHGFTHDI